MVFKLFNVGSFYVADTAKGKIEIVINWLFPQWDKFYCSSAGYPYRSTNRWKCHGCYNCHCIYTGIHGIKYGRNGR